MKKFAPVSSTATKNFRSIAFTIQELFHEQATVLYFEMDSSWLDFAQSTQIDKAACQYMGQLYELIHLSTIMLLADI